MNTPIDNIIEFIESQNKRILPTYDDFADWVHNGMVFNNAEAREFMELLAKLESSKWNVGVQAAVQIAEIIRGKIVAEYERKAESWKAEQPIGQL